jgi:hypothetical protein
LAHLALGQAVQWLIRREHWWRDRSTIGARTSKPMAEGAR